MRKRNRTDFCKVLREIDWSKIHIEFLETEENEFYKSFQVFKEWLQDTEVSNGDNDTGND